MAGDVGGDGDPEVVQRVGTAVPVAGCHCRNCTGDVPYNPLPDQLTFPGDHFVSQPWASGVRLRSWPGVTPSTPEKAPESPSPGLSSRSLGEYLESYIRACKGRVEGIGADQYELDNGQQFEQLPVTDLLTMAMEELQDIAAYAAMLHIRLQWMKDKL